MLLEITYGISNIFGIFCTYNVHLNVYMPEVCIILGKYVEEILSCNYSEIIFLRFNLLTTMNCLSEKQNIYVLFL